MRQRSSEREIVHSGKKNHCVTPGEKYCCLKVHASRATLLECLNINSSARGSKDDGVADFVFFQPPSYVADRGSSIFCCCFCLEKITRASRLEMCAKYDIAFLRTVRPEKKSIEGLRFQNFTRNDS